MGRMIFYFLILMTGCIGGPDSETTSQKSRVDLALVLLQGQQADYSALTLKIFDKKAHEIVYSKKTNQPDKSSNIFHINKEDYLKLFQFDVTDSGGNKIPINSYLSLIRYPTGESLNLNSRNIHEIIFELSPEFNLEPGQKIQVTFVPSGKTSNIENVKIYSQDFWINLNRQCRVEIALGNADRLLNVADQLIQIKSDSAVGYYYRGLGFEMLKKPAEARAAFEKAGSLFKQNSSLQEPPMKLIQKLNSFDFQ